MIGGALPGPRRRGARRDDRRRPARRRSAGAAERARAARRRGPRRGAPADARGRARPQGSPARAELDDHLAALDAWKKDTRTGGPMRPPRRRRARGRRARACSTRRRRRSRPRREAVDAWIGRAMRSTVALQYSSAAIAPRARRRPSRSSARCDGGATTMAALFLRARRRARRARALYKTGAGGVHARPASSSTAHPRARPQERRRGRLARARGGLRGSAIRRTSEPSSRHRPASCSPRRSGAPRSRPTGAIRSRSTRGAPRRAACSCASACPRPRPSCSRDALARSRRPQARQRRDGAAPARRARRRAPTTRRRTRRGACSTRGAGPRSPTADKGRRRAVERAVRFVMAGIEVRAGNLAAAGRSCGERSRREPSTSGLHDARAWSSARPATPRRARRRQRALAAPDAREAGARRGRRPPARLRAAPRRRPQAAGQGRARRRAHRRARRAPARGNAAARARAERLLGRVLEGYGDAKGAARAFERALAAAAADRPTLGAAMLDAIGRALVRRDLDAARAALKRGIEGDVSDEDLVYGGLWVSLLEREVKAPTDGDRRARAPRGAKSAWTAKLAAWASGKLATPTCSAAAQSASQRVEAAFYTAMARSVAGDPTADHRLRGRERPRHRSARGAARARDGLEGPAPLAPRQRLAPLSACSQRAGEPPRRQVHQASPKF